MSDFQYALDFTQRRVRSTRVGHQPFRAGCFRQHHQPTMSQSAEPGERRRQCMATGWMIDEGGMVLATIDPFQASCHAPTRLDAPRAPLQGHPVAKADGNRKASAQPEWR